MLVCRNVCVSLSINLEPCAQWRAIDAEKMKSLKNLTALFSLASIASLSMALMPMAHADPLPGSTLLSRLPKDATLLVKKEFALDRPTVRGEEYFFFIYRVSRNSRYDLNRSVWIRCQNSRSFPSRQNDPVKLRIKSVVADNPLQIYDSNSNPIYVLHELNMYFTTDQPALDAGCRIRIDTADLPEPTTVAQAMEYLSTYFEFVNDVDPYAGLEKSVVVDLLMAKITNSLKADDNASALKAFAQLEKTSDQLPESFYYYYAETLAKAGDKGQARSYAALYLKKYGRNGKYYKQAVDVMSRVSQ